MKPGSTSSLNPYAESYVPVSKRVGANGKDDVSYAGSETNGPKDGPMAAFQSQGHAGRTGSLYVAEDSKLSAHPGNGIHGPSSYNAAEVTEKPTENVESEMDIAYMQLTFPGIADEFLSEIYSVSQGDLESAIDMVKQLVLPDTLDIGDVPESASAPESNGLGQNGVNGGTSSSGAGSAV